MEQYQVTGMSCAACSARVEKAVSRVPGVTSCSVSLLTNSMAVEGTADEAAIVAAVTEAGYGAKRKAAEPSAARPSDALEALEDHETPKLKRRLIASVGFLLVLMYLSMGHMMWGWPLPGFLEGNHVAMGLTEMLLTIIIMVINQRFFLSGFRSLLHRAPNMDTLVALGSAAAFGYSTYALFAMTAAQLHGDAELVMHYMDEFYFESAAMILTLITVGKMLEARSKGKTTDALKSTHEARAQRRRRSSATARRPTFPSDRCAAGDIFVVRPGESIPVDGVVVEGSSAVNEAALTGESIPVDKAAGDTVSAATHEPVRLPRAAAPRASARIRRSSQIIRMVSDAAATKAPIAKLADRVSGVFVPVVIGIALVTLVVWMLVGQTVGLRAGAAPSPCSSSAARARWAWPRRWPSWSATALAQSTASCSKPPLRWKRPGDVEIVALDKTGTITQGEPRGHGRCCLQPGVTEDELLRLADALEAAQRASAGPCRGAPRGRNGSAPRRLRDFTRAARQRPDGRAGRAEACWAAAPAFAAERCQHCRRRCSDRAVTRWRSRARRRCSSAADGKLLGVIAVADVIKPDSPQAVRELQGMGIRVVMLTGDNERTAKAIGAQAGVDEVIAGVLPDGKEAVIRRLKEQGKVAMVGDGINDAPRPDARGHRHRHRRGHGRRHRRGGRRAHEEPSARCSGCHPPEPRHAAQHPREPVLGVLLQCHRHPACRRCMVSACSAGS